MNWLISNQLLLRRSLLTFCNIILLYTLYSLHHHCPLIAVGILQSTKNGFHIVLCWFGEQWYVCAGIFLLYTFLFKDRPYVPKLFQHSNNSFHFVITNCPFNPYSILYLSHMVFFEWFLIFFLFFRFVFTQVLHIITICWLEGAGHQTKAIVETWFQFDCNFLGFLFGE